MYARYAREMRADYSTSSQRRVVVVFAVPAYCCYSALFFISVRLLDESVTTVGLKMLELAELECLLWSLFRMFFPVRLAFLFLFHFLVVDITNFKIKNV